MSIAETPRFVSSACLDLRPYSAFVRNPYLSGVGSWRGLALVAALILVMAVSAGCGSTGGTAVSNSEAETRVESSSTSPAAPEDPNALGSEVAFTGDGVSIRVAVFGFDPVAATQAPAPSSGGHWAAADVRTCVDTASTPVLVSWSEWSLFDEESGRYPSANLTYGQFPTPEYPFTSETVNAGDCVRGWVLFGVAGDAVIDRVRFTPNGEVNATWSTAGSVDIPDAVQEPVVMPQAVPSPKVEEPAEPVSVVTVGEPCSQTSAVGVDEYTGENIVCVYLGAGGGTKWVGSVPIVGVNQVGTACDSSSGNASQTPEGLAVMCVGDEWTYGP
ncbi:hypothetical protein [Rhodococcus sp. Eu-32]|uniref:hypothetical protein n=1 Tax=Rhodococcus sp. Eu-32 TaxID=1017319 RepID=UPI001FB24250|nr:hypothetical protein [Rhodococcus sp. Eu-32]